ncbi:MAG: hypothetical protein GYA17_14230 [Chloroflexi bacterium]|nr:hypothetical protein [Chloroflexota bacterium]
MSEPVPLETPFPDSYWVIPGHLLAGAYPGTRRSEEETRRRLRRMISMGINYFLDLTQTEELQSYHPLLDQEAAALQRPVEHHRYPIRDLDIPVEQQMVEILDAIDQAILAGKVLYVHCWGGIGRTGTVIGCYLARHGLVGDQGLKYIAERRRNIPDWIYRSPETEAQWAMVRNWPAGK